MIDKLEISINLMLSGMITVFTILLIVVLSSKVLINLVNRFSTQNVALSPDSDTIEPKKMAILKAAISEITGGKGVIQKIEKI